MKKVALPRKSEISVQGISHTIFLNIVSQAYLTKKSLTLERAEEVFDKVDKDNSEQINYLEFVAATVPAW